MKTFLAQDSVRTTQLQSAAERDSGGTASEACTWLRGSARLAAQRQAIKGFGFAEPVQRVAPGEEDEEPVQAKAVAQRAGVEEEDELPLQGRFAPVQREADGRLDDEELPLQARVEVGQRVQAGEQDDEAVLQGRFEVEGAVQRAEEGGTDSASVSSVSASESPNLTGMPNQLKAGIESLSGMDMSDVRVHRNSDKPAQLNALAYAQGNDIHLGPGQEQHLPHEAWHVVQQRQGRVRETMQMAGVGVNDEVGLEREADLMGGRAVLQGAGLGLGGKRQDLTPMMQPVERSQIGEEASAMARNPANSETVTVPASALPGVAQRVGIKRLRVGISGEKKSLGIYARDLERDTYVWILTNEVGGVDALNAENLDKRAKASSPGQIIAANFNNFKNPIYGDIDRANGSARAGIFQSGPFIVPRKPSTINPDGTLGKHMVDFSFLRYAALQCYRLWHVHKGAADGWPGLTEDTTLVETIDSDMSGIKGQLTWSDQVEGDAGKTQTIKTGWLAEAGCYRWDWRDVKDDAGIIKRFTSPDQTLDAAARDTALSDFSKAYSAAEIDARAQAAEADILSIYFPEPATRLSADAIRLLNEGSLSNMKVTLGEQIGHARESVGMIAALVCLDMAVNKDKFESSKKKLRFTKNFVVTTGLGWRKPAYASLFLLWHNERRKENQDVDLRSLNKAKEFDQSYLNDDMAGQVSNWHYKTIGEMESSQNAAPGFFHPK